ncbi:class I SAM-dependent methyltransferase [Rhodoferax sp.]|uniref:class I SAM-dependent methyltransferase n=1 Tax=Rhodoferax sp. TaxID=50421 RepID=UPI002639CC07|nr:class I SAM-dependent methyltransferase [Rhodoferax sp.]MDD4945240.1 class I SAM-dependent methyltransferase [Rhodoferax sp.]MDD5480798.1 class I SAM-dependent methyltransferase [Rhodoferax sp.]
MVAHPMGEPSAWVRCWRHLLKPGARVLDVACGQGRHMKWLSEAGFQCLGVDRCAESLQVAAAFGQVCHADIEQGDWPLMTHGQLQTFDAVVVTNYLWRPLFPTLLASLAPGGVLLYETFSAGNERLGKPSRPDFLLQPGELLKRCAQLQVVAFEEGRLENPARCVQRIVAIQAANDATEPLAHCAVSLESLADLTPN